MASNRSIVTVPSEGRLVGVEPDGVGAVKARDIHSYDPERSNPLVVPGSTSILTSAMISL